MNILHKIKNSIYGKDYYKDLSSKPFSYSLKYFLFITLIVSLFYTFYYSSFSVVPYFKEAAGKLGGEIDKRYPGNLEIYFTDGVISSNAKEPFLLKVTDVFDPKEDHGFFEQGIENLLVIDTKNDVSIDKIRDYKTFLFFSESDIAFYNTKKGEIRVYSVEKIDGFTINKETLLSLAESIKSNQNIILFVIILLVFFALFVGIALNLLYILIIALPVWGIAGIKKMSIGYKKSYQLSLHLITLPLLLDFLLLLLKVSHVPFLFTIILLSLAALNLGAEEEKETVSDDLTETTEQDTDEP
jgi:hypothetical protein